MYTCPVDKQNNIINVHFLLIEKEKEIGIYKSNAGFVTRLTPRRVSLVEQELLSLPEHLSSPLDFSGDRVTRFLVLYVCFVDRPFVLFLLVIVLSVLV